MRLHALLFTAMLVAGPVAAGQSASSPAPKPSSEPAAAGGQSNAQSADLPVSLDKIREALEHTPQKPIQVNSSQTAHFRVEIQERRKIEELLATLDFKTGPTVPGGWQAYEMQRIVRPPQDYPLAQPYAAFSTSELLVIAIENLAVKYLGGRLLDAVTAAERARAERAARDEVARAMGEFCAAQPNRGAGLQACAVGAATR